ncbi:hypothetical protein KIPB_009147 [Kipferlia bialata]|uniref:Kelch repeat type 1 n=1 Tax=Kipferlia bialata TaxID=797122 RepID=A0A9K3GLW8_9EUKA|nr:hypothetical protein KIPB_009147 [Kipferlia bialata]|eukprot:g9147.t1
MATLTLSGWLATRSWDVRDAVLPLREDRDRTQATQAFGSVPVSETSSNACEIHVPLDGETGEEREVGVFTVTHREIGGRAAQLDIERVYTCEDNAPDQYSVSRIQRDLSDMPSVGDSALPHVGGAVSWPMWQGYSMVGVTHCVSIGHSMLVFAQLEVDGAAMGLSPWERRSNREYAGGVFWVDHTHTHRGSHMWHIRRGPCPTEDRSLSGYSVAMVGHNVYCFGGTSGRTVTYDNVCEYVVPCEQHWPPVLHWHDEVRVYSTETDTWHTEGEVEGSREYWPGARENASSYGVDGSLYIYGGINKGGLHCSEIVCYNTETHQWTRHLEEGDIPRPKEYANQVHVRYIKDSGTSDTDDGEREGRVSDTGTHPAHSIVYTDPVSGESSVLGCLPTTTRDMEVPCLHTCPTGLLVFHQVAPHTEEDIAAEEEWEMWGKGRSRAKSWISFIENIDSGCTFTCTP